MIEKLEKHEELVLSQEVRRKLLAISPATMDRLLQKEKRKLTPVFRSYTKPGTLLKHRIPVRTFADWDDGMRKNQDSVKSIWLPTMAETPVVI